MAFAAGAKGAARHECYVLAHQELFGEFFRSIAGAADAREDIEGAFRLEAFEPELREAVINEAAALVVFRDHFLHVFFAMTQGFDCGNLCRNRCAEHGVLMDLGHGSDDDRIGQGIADAPARHGIGLGKAIQQDRTVLHMRQGGEAYMLFTAIGEVTVDFIRNHDEIVLFCKVSNLHQVFTRHDGTCRIVRIADEQSPRFRGKVLFKLRRCDAEVVFQPCRYGYGHAASQ